jgi:hypothetical protein
MMLISVAEMFEWFKFKENLKSGFVAEQVSWIVIVQELNWSGLWHDMVMLVPIML